MVVDLLDPGIRAEIRPRLSKLRRVELRRLVVGAVAHVPDHVIGGERAPVVPFHAFTQLENPALGVAFVDVPFGGETRLDVGCLVALGQIPQHQEIVEVVADKPVAFEPLVGIAGGLRQITRGHADREGAAGLGSGSPEQRRDAGAQRRLQNSNPHQVPPKNCSDADGSRYCATLTRVRSWNQLCAWMKPFTFGDRPRGLRSCTMNTMTACRPSSSCSWVSS